MRTSASWLSPGKLAAAFTTLLPGIHAIAYSSIPSPDLDLSQLGRVALAGDFDSISLYTYTGQNENSFSTNGTQSLITRYPNGAFQDIALSDAYIETMCPFVQKDGTLAGVVVGGNFTSLGGVQAQGIALWNPNTTAITPLPGLSGHVSSVYCDQDSSTVYVGGSFSGGNSTNAIAWTTGWTNLPFAGFNGPVTSITKTSNGSIVFGGSFTGLGSTSTNSTTTSTTEAQVINLSSGNITSESTTSTSAYSDPKNIICNTGSGNSWLLDDDTAGYWAASFGFGFNPTKLRLYNTNQDGRGTKIFRFTALPIDGIMNLTYTDTDGSTAYCSSQCPLPENNSTYQDFEFVNVIGMNAFRIDISAWYGSGGGLSGIELFQNDIYAFAIANFNEPSCDSVSTTGANATATGPWVLTPSGSSTSDYLTANLTNATITTDSASVVFKPDIKESGNYSITVYTPGCLGDDTCSTRGLVNITGTMTTENAAISTTLHQTNDYDKYDQVYYGYVDAGSTSYRPTITLTPATGQTGPLTIVAQRVRFELMASNDGLNGLYEYNPNEATVSTDYSSSAIDAAGTSLNTGATVNALAVYSTSTYVAGNFTANGISNIFSINGANTTSLPGGGLNSEVLTMYQNGSLLYVGGNFTNTAESTFEGLNGVAAFSASSNTWQALGTGVNGPVWAIVPLQLNISSGDLETVLTISGAFTEVNAVGKNVSFSANGFAVWVPTQSNWLHNLDSATVSISGELLTQTAVPGFSPLLAGSISSQSLGLSDAAALSGSGQPSLQSLGVSITANQQTSSSLRKRASTSSQNITGVAAGLFYLQNGLNLTILGGHFSANASDGSTINNFLILNDTATQKVTGLPNTIDADSQFLSMDTHGTTVWAGGVVSGTVSDNNVNGVIVYDLSTAALATSQPPALTDSTGTVSVNAVAAQPSSSSVFVGGSFSNAGSLSCPSLCMYDTSAMQWMSPGIGLGGSIAAMTWASNTKLVIAGNLTASGNATTMATYDSKKQTFAEFPGASGLPGPVSALASANSAYDQFWVAGTSSTNGSFFLEKYDGTNWTPVTGLGASTSIRGLQIMSLTSNHASSTLVDADKVLLITGTINVPDYGNASAVLFNGTTFQPFILTNTEENGQGSLARMFVQNPSNFLSSSSHHIAIGLVVLIGLGIALGLIFLIVLAGIFIERYRRRREGYVPMAQLRPDQHANLSRIPPESLFGTLTEKDRAPKI